MAQTPSPADRTFARLRHMAEGNGVSTDSIELIEKAESLYTLRARMQLAPHMEAKTEHYPGPARKRAKESFANFSTLRNAIAARQQAFSSSSKWIDEAKKQIMALPGKGWGLENARITLASETVVLNATEICPACNGRKMNTCPQCQGNKQVICAYCQGTGKENCPNCFGRGEDPVTPNQKCPVCLGTRQTMCRYCHGIGWLPCPTCQGRGGMLCPQCQGAGKLTEEITLEASALPQFRMDKSEGLPSGLLRALDRLGIANIAKGHADISLDTPQRKEDEPEPPANVLFYKAVIPFADLRMRFNKGHVVMVSVFGKKGAVLGCPSFLDEAIATEREHLRHAAAGLAPIEKALTVRALREALDIVLSRKGGNSTGNMKELRHLYPYGLSTDAIKEIIRDTTKTLGRITRRSRTVMALTAGILSAVLLGGLILSPMQIYFIKSFQPAFAVIMDLLALGGVSALGWFAISQASQRALQKRFPETIIPRQAKIGKIGYSFLASSALVWILFLLFAPVRPF